MTEIGERRILVLEPFGGGSHRSLYEGWSRYSRHQFEVLELPAVHWKWRSRHASLTLAEQANRLIESGQKFDVVFCSEMLNLPEWRGLACEQLAALPAVVYFHENQFTYPLSEGESRDYHFAYSNCLTAVAANEIWFNSEYHRQEFGNAARAWLRRMPDYPHLDAFDDALEKSRVFPPGIEPPEVLPARNSLEVVRATGGSGKSRELEVGVPTVGWVSRWEHDKRPEDFAAAVIELAKRGTPFQLILLGQQFAKTPDALRKIQNEIPDRIAWCSFAEDQSQYWQLLSGMDVVVSTAAHEFFGIGIIEAVAAGARPLLPRALAYPETMQLADNPERERFFYDGKLSADALGKALVYREHGSQDALVELRHDVNRFNWRSLAKAYDHAIERLV